MAKSPTKRDYRIASANPKYKVGDRVTVVAFTGDATVVAVEPNTKGDAPFVVQLDRIHHPMGRPPMVDADYRGRYHEFEMGPEGVRPAVCQGRSATGPCCYSFGHNDDGLGLACMTTVELRSVLKRNRGVDRLPG